MPENLETGGAKLKGWLAATVTIIALIGLGAFILYLLGSLTTTELTWARATYLYASVEAIAFASVGWLFGREVHREQARSAEARANSAEQKAMSAEQQAASNLKTATALRDVIVTKAAGITDTSDDSTLSLGNGAALDSALRARDLRELAEIANRLVPPQV